MCFGSQIFFLLQSSKMTRRGQILMSLDPVYVLDALKLTTYALGTMPIACVEVRGRGL
jgi:hypothetical protein